MLSSSLRIGEVTSLEQSGMIRTMITRQLSTQRKRQALRLGFNMKVLDTPESIVIAERVINT